MSRIIVLFVLLVCWLDNSHTANTIEQKPVYEYAIDLYGTADISHRRT